MSKPFCVLLSGEMDGVGQRLFEDLIDMLIPQGLYLLDSFYMLSGVVPGLFLRGSSS